jgi:hypothetical protein
MNYNMNKGSVLKMLNKYPIIDAIFISILKFLIINDELFRLNFRKDNLNNKEILNL